MLLASKILAVAGFFLFVAAAVTCCCDRLCSKRSALNRSLNGKMQHIFKKSVDTNVRWYYNTGIPTNDGK